VYITISKKRDLFRMGAMSLLATVKTPFIFMSITDAYLDAMAIEALARHDCTYAVLEDYVAADDAGNLSLIRPLTEEKPVEGAPEPEPANSIVREGALWKWTYAGLTIMVESRCTTITLTIIPPTKPRKAYLKTGISGYKRNRPVAR
jgi:hypothetical protein